MHYPCKRIRIRPDFSLFLPDPEQVRPVYEKLCQADSQTPFPYWAKTWAAAKAMTAFLQAEPAWIEGKNVLEIGAGTGLPSFSIARLTASVLISDQAAEAVELMKKNIQELELNNTRALQLDWNDFPDTLTADIILLSDTSYEPAQFAPLLELIQKMLNRGTVFIIATPQRMMAAPFVDALSPYTCRSFIQTVDDSDQLAEIRILILSKASDS